MHGRCVCLLIAVLACAPRAEVRRAPPYSDHVQHGVTLRAPMALIQEVDDYGPVTRPDVFLVNAVEAAPREKPENWKVVGTLAAGTPLRVESAGWIRPNYGARQMLEVVLIVHAGDFAGTAVHFRSRDGAVGDLPWEDTAN